MGETREGLEEAKPPATARAPGAYGWSGRLVEPDPSLAQVDWLRRLGTGLVALAWSKGALSAIEARKRWIVYRLTRVPVMEFVTTLLASLSDSPIVQRHRISSRRKGRNPRARPFLSSGSAALPGYGNLMAGAVKPSKVTVYLKSVTVMLCTSSLQLRLGHVNAPVTSPAVILSLMGSMMI